jgi:hypothetical protein
MECGEAFVCCVNIGEERVLKGSVGGGWEGVFMKNRPIEIETKREVAYLGRRLGCAALVFRCEHCSEDVARLFGSGGRTGIEG